MTGKGKGKAKGDARVEAATVRFQNVAKPDKDLQRDTLRINPDDIEVEKVGEI